MPITVSEEGQLSEGSRPSYIRSVQAAWYSRDEAPGSELTEPAQEKMGLHLPVRPARPARRLQLLDLQLTVPGQVITAAPSRYSWHHRVCRCPRPHRRAEPWARGGQRADADYGTGSYAVLDATCLARRRQPAQPRLLAARSLGFVSYHFVDGAHSYVQYQPYDGSPITQVLRRRRSMPEATRSEGNWTSTLARASTTRLPSPTIWMPSWAAKSRRTALARRRRCPLPRGSWAMRSSWVREAASRGRDSVGSGGWAHDGGEACDCDGADATLLHHTYEAQGPGPGRAVGMIGAERARRYPTGSNRPVNLMFFNQSKVCG